MTEPEKPSTPEEAAKAGEKVAVTRRDFLSEVTLGALGIAGLGSALVTYQYFSPNVLFEPSMTFRAGNPDLYPVNSVTYLQEQEVYIVRAEQGFYAVSAICTHLGCITSVESGTQADRMPLPRQQVPKRRREGRWTRACDRCHIL